MRMSYPILACAIGVGSLTPTGALAQEHRVAERPSIGVALSGGAALGLAHIGVIRYFEEHHIPIDEVGGTSMGGLVGGLFAVGMDSAEIESLAQQADWNALLNPSPPFADQPIVDKQNWNRTFGSLTLRFGKRFALPTGLNPGESLSLFLSRSTLGYSDVSDFDQLPTPFRCVATDLVSGDSVVLSKGSLPVAMRATMSLPGIFTPVKLKDMVLVDGGVLENIPVDAVRNMGADLVIAVALETNRPSPDQIKTLPDVMRQTIALTIVKNEQRSEAKADLVISVNTRRFSGNDYPRWKEIVDAGYEAAKAHESQLARFEVSPEDWDAYISARRSRMRRTERRGKVLAIASPDPSFQKNAESEMRRTIADKTVSEQRLEEVLSGMVAATAVPGAAYDWQQDDSEEGGYRVKFAERPTDQVLARISAQYSVSSGEPSRFGTRLSTVIVPQDAYKTRILGTANIGYDPSIQAEFYKPFGGTQYFVAPQFYGGRTHFNSYSGATRQSDTRDRVSGAMYGGIGTWRFAQLRLGTEAGYDSYSRSVTVDGVRSRSGGFLQPQLRWSLNDQDSGGLPSRGTRFEGSAGYLFRRTGSYPVFQSEYSTFKPLDRHLTLFASHHAGTGFGRKMDYFDQFIAGDQGNMPAFRYQEFHADTLVTAGSGMILHPWRIPHVSSHPGLAVWYEAGRFDLGSQGWKTHQSTSIGTFFPTQVGATGLELSFDENGRARFRLMLGSF
jgi:NTE family protein